MDQQNLAKSLRIWALDEMKYHDSQIISSNRSHPLPSEDDFSLTVKQVKGNLALQHTMRSRKLDGNTQNEEEESLLKQINQLAREINHCKQENNYMEKEMAQTSKSLMAKSLAYEKIAMQVRDVQRKKGILFPACNVVYEKVIEYAEYARRIDSFSDSMINKREVAKAELWRSMKEVDLNYNITTICSSLAANAIQFAKSIRDEAIRVNIALDAQNLSFTMNEKGQLLDVSKPPSVQKNVQQLLQASHFNHMMRWFETEKHKNESWKVEAQLDDLKAQIHKLIHKVLGEHSYNVPLAKTYVDLLLQLAAERAVVPCLQKEMNFVVERISKAKSEKEELHAKFSKIQEFKQVAEQKQNCISLLARHNTSAPERLEKKRNQVKSYIESRSISSHDTRVRSSAGNFSGSFKGEVDKFSSLSLPCLLTVSMDSNTLVNVLDLSIAPSVISGAWDLFQIYPALCVALDIPEYKSPDQVARHIRDLLVDSQTCTHSLRQTEAGIQAACEKAQTRDDISGIRDLCQTAVDHDKTESQTLMPLIHKSMEVLDSMRKDLPNLRSEIKVWWDQPAKFLTPWVKAEGMTFEQWMSRWRIVVTAIHKNMAAKQTSAPPR